jgi:DNA-binding response OmpR family regulator/DNA-binding CsgD family transcriptional regulator
MNLLSPKDGSDRPSVLLVDDMPANLSVLLDFLIGTGFEVLVAESGERALLQLAYRRPDLILLDVMMPGLDGLETCRLLKADPAVCNIPVLFMTALTETVDKLAGFAAGAVDYISKPFEPGEVLARLRAHLELQRLRRALEDEVRLRRESEAQLQQSLAQAVLVSDAEGRIAFCTRRAGDLLRKYFNYAGAAAPLPASLLQRLPVSPVANLRVRRFAEAAEAGTSSLFVLLLEEAALDRGFAPLVSLGLTERQAEVLYWVAQGKTSSEIALILSAAVKTVKKHLQRIYDKLGVDTRTAAALRASDILRQPGA